MSHSSLSRKVSVSAQTQLKRTWLMFTKDETEPAPAETYETPYPFSVWSYHDNLPEYDVIPVGAARRWQLVALLFAGVALAALLWWGFAASHVGAAQG